jgi:hypothetical protein
METFKALLAIIGFATLAVFSLLGLVVFSFLVYCWSQFGW